MTTITTKYSIGDVVWHAGIAVERRQHPCPDCHGEKLWKAISPAGEEYTFSCPRCSAAYSSNNSLSLQYSAYAPSIRRLTIGSVRVDTSGDRNIEYMCHETGIGSGSLWSEGDLFLTEDEALTVAKTKASLTNTTTEWIVKLYDKSLSLSDYQFSNALTEAARMSDIRRRVDVDMLFQDLRSAETAEEVMRVVDEFAFRD